MEKIELKSYSNRSNIARYIRRTRYVRFSSEMDTIQWN